MNEEDLKEITKNPDAVVFLIYKGIEGAMNGLEEYKLGKKNFANSGEMKYDFGEIIDGYFNRLPYFERITLKTVMSLPWNETLGLIYNFALNLGKNGVGDYKSTIDVLKDCFTSYGNKLWVT